MGRAQQTEKKSLCQEFVKKKQGRWNHSDWLTFLSEVRTAGYRVISDDDVGTVLGEAKSEFWEDYWALRRQFVEEKKGAWNHSDWLTLLASVRKAGYDFLTDDEIGKDVEQVKSSYWERRIESGRRGSGFGSLQQAFSELIEADFWRAVGFLDSMIDTHEFGNVMAVLPILCATRHPAGVDRLRAVIDRALCEFRASRSVICNISDVQSLLEKSYPGELTLIERVRQFRDSLQVHFSGINFDDGPR